MLYGPYFGVQSLEHITSSRSTLTVKTKHKLCYITYREFTYLIVSRWMIQSHHNLQTRFPTATETVLSSNVS